MHGWASDVIRDPTNNAARHSLTEALRGELAKRADSPSLADTNTKRLVTVLDDVETPGKLRKVGPSLRHVASKNDFAFLYSWVRQPNDFRPSTKMPQFFGLWSHLDGKGLKDAQRYEPLEIRGAVEYLLAKSQPFEYIPRARM